jgi:hypothetical protein
VLLVLFLEIVTDKATWIRNRLVVTTRRATIPLKIISFQ